MTDNAWTVAQAKAKFSELLNRAQETGPQPITRNGKLAAVVVSAEEWARKTQRVGNLAEFFAASPLRGSGLKLARLKIARDPSSCELPARHERRVRVGQPAAPRRRRAFPD